MFQWTALEEELSDWRWVVNWRAPRDRYHSRGILLRRTVFLHQLNGAAGCCGYVRAINLRLAIS